MNFFDIKLSKFLSELINPSPTPTPIGQDNTSNVPHEVMQRIFLDISFKDMKQCVLVSKKWCALINDVNLWNSLAARVGLPCFSEPISFVSKKQIILTPLLDWKQQIGTRDEFSVFLKKVVRNILPNRPYQVRFEANDNCYLDIYLKKSGVTRQIFFSDLKSDPNLIKLKVNLKTPSEILTPTMYRYPNREKEVPLGPGTISMNKRCEQNYYGFYYNNSDQFCLDFSTLIEQVLEEALGKEQADEKKTVSPFFSGFFQ